MLESHVAAPQLVGGHRPVEVLGESELLFHLPADVHADLGDRGFGRVGAVVVLDGSGELHDQGSQEGLLVERALGSCLGQGGKRQVRLSWGS